MPALFIGMQPDGERLDNCAVERLRTNDNGHGEVMRVHPASSSRHRDRFWQAIVPLG